MGKQGPCRHCGVTSKLSVADPSDATGTPLWRNGPPEKPVLCNACGSRWRTKGSLANYTPMHARELIELEDFKGSRVISIPPKPMEQKLHKKKQTTNLVEIDCGRPYSDQNFKKILEEDTSNRSSSGSAISFVESCAHFGTMDPSDLTGSAQSNVWDSLVPSRKRTCVARPKPSRVEKLTRDLYSIWHEQQLSHISGSSNVDLLFESEAPFGYNEIGNGGVLIGNPNPKNAEEESEASSILVDNKSYSLNEAHSSSAPFCWYSRNKVGNSSLVAFDRLKKSTAQVLQGHAKSDKPFDEISQILHYRGSPLCSTDLKEVLSFEVFLTQLTHEEQRKLMRYIPPEDNAKLPESLKSMFWCSQFTEACSYYQLLLGEGVFDLSFVGVSAEECTTLKRLVLLNLDQNKWVEHYKELKKLKPKTLEKEGVNETTNEPSFGGHSNLTPLKRLCHNKNQRIQETEGAMRSPKGVHKSGGMNFCSAKLLPNYSGDTVSKAVSDIDDDEGSCFSPSCLFALTPERTCLISALQFADGNSEEDLLFDVSCNAPTPEAELLRHPWKQKRLPNASPERSTTVREERRSNFKACTVSGLPPPQC